MSYIQVRHISKIFGNRAPQALQRVKDGIGKAELMARHRHALALYDVNLSIQKGEVFVIMGLSGCGKSTLIRHFNRLIEPTEGEILIDQQRVHQLNARQLRQFRREYVSMVFQHFGLLPHRSVLDNVAFGIGLQKHNKREQFALAKEWLHTVGLGNLAKQYPKQLSGGQQQRVGLARALAADTPILLMDEAFSALDPLIRSKMQTELLALQQQLCKTVIFITHDWREALRLGNRIAILQDGRIAQIGTADEIIQAPANAYVREFVQSCPSA